MWRSLTARAGWSAMPIPEAGCDGRSRRLLILGGTAEAAALAQGAVDRLGDRLEVITSLAGRTAAPAAVAGAVRVGGFGGVGGLADYLRETRVDLVVDATHPFAETISAHARAACDAVGVPRLILLRPPWRCHPRDRWTEVADLAEAAAMLPTLGRRALLTVGVKSLGAFGEVTGVWFLVRLIDPPKEPLPMTDYRVILGRGPFTIEAERALLAHHRVDVLVAKASGGDATAAKIAAAREAGIPVVMVRRPLPEPGERVAAVAAALAWVGRRLDDLDGRGEAERGRTEAGTQGS